MTLANTPAKKNPLSVLEVYHLRSEGNALYYEKILSSEEVKGIDLDLLLRLFTDWVRGLQSVLWDICHCRLC